ncbi:unnamed protein product [Echinostoma caproni]|uniref:Cadherin domain-containing protein n=1 Tax=Echinostoma caproni TaxID=27848 RepID=A0A183A8V1_9TREM|nr:unnamed protein product [Echinostoma caproni]
MRYLFTLVLTWFVTLGFLFPHGHADLIVNAAAQYRLRYAITENQPEDLRIGKLDDDLIQTPEVRSAELFSLFHSSTHGALRYKLRDPSNHFNLDERTSILSTKQSIDLESLCPRYCRDGATRAQLTQMVNILYEQRLVALVHVEVTVIDVDDNPPRFPATIPRPYVLQLKEVIYRVGQQVELPRAVDADVQPDHAEIAYRLESFPDDRTNALEVFHLVARNDSRLMLVLQRDLDYEDVKSYHFYLIAWSPRLGDRSRKPFQSGQPTEFQDKLEILVNVLNINDISPVFSQSLYTVQLSEDTKIGSMIYKFEATDGDENSTIRYTMEEISDPDIQTLFKLESDGEVRLLNSLDYEKRTKYAFSVRASDGEFFALTRLELTVTDVNDERPEFVSNPTTLTVQENEPPETYVGQLFITDRDSPEVNGHVSCQEPEHLAGKQPLLFHLQMADLVLTGGGTLPLGSPAIGPEHRVYQRFDLYSRHSFDRETDPHVHQSLLVCSDGQSSDSFPYDQAKDVERPRLTGTLTILLTVADQNDNVPVFERQYYEAELKENSPRGTRVVQVHANDADSEPHAKPRYRLLHNELFTSHFEVESETGWIVTYADIDREAQSIYQLTVLAVDGWQNDTDPSRTTVSRSRSSAARTQHTASTRVQIRVLDENDNAPEFRGPRQFAVEENQPPNTWIGDLQVMDRDEGKNKEVEFMLLSRPQTGEKSGLESKKSESNTTMLSQGKIPLRLGTNGSLYTTAKLDRENQVCGNRDLRNFVSFLCDKTIS